MNVRLSGISQESIVDGLGLRYVIFVQGCPHRCYQCHNPSTHCFDGGHLRDTEELVMEFFKNPLLKGITFSGGEPFEQPAPLIEIAKAVRSFEMNSLYGRKTLPDIWCYTGYSYEDLIQSTDKVKKELLKQIDVLVDGKFIFEKKTIEKPFVGSSNQRVIDVSRSTVKNVLEIDLLS